MQITYIQAIGLGFPNVGCIAAGSGSVYEDIIWDSGEPIPSKNDLDAWVLAYVKSQMWELIKIERDRRKSNMGYKVGSNWFHSDDFSRIQQIGLVMMGAGIPAGLQWKTMSGSFVTMTQTLAAQIFQAAAASDINLFTVAEQKNAAMLVSADPSAYDYLSGWPLGYGE